MMNSTLKALSQPEKQIPAPLSELLRSVARDLIAQAVEAEFQVLLEQYAVVHNGYLPEHTVQTGIDDIKVKMPKVHDQSRSGIRFSSSLYRLT